MPMAPNASAATGISVRYFRKTRGDVANVTLATLRRVERAIPEVALSQSEKLTSEQELLAWACAERDRIGLRELGRQLDANPAYLAKVLSGKRRASRRLIKVMTRLHGNS